jgi:hypothetical protein
MTAEYRHCATCDATMHPVIWRAHVRSKQHREAGKAVGDDARLFARAMFTLAAGLTAFGWVSIIDNGPDIVVGTFLLGAVVALVGGVLVGRK